MGELRRAAVGGGLLALARDAVADRYDEGYERGVHDHNAARILEALLRLNTDAGLLRYPGTARATAQFFWTHGTQHRLPKTTRPAPSRRSALQGSYRDLTSSPTSRQGIPTRPVPYPERRAG